MPELDERPNVGAYERISFDPNGTALGVDRQRTDNETVARLRGFRIHKHYTDNDLSAFKENVIRPAFEELLSDLASGRIDGIVCYNLDRFARKTEDLDRAIKIFDQARYGPRKMRFATVEGDIDLASDDGLTMARVMVTFANKSSRDTARRVRRAHLALAQAGVPVGGSRPFGWQADRRTLDTREASAIVEAVDRLLKGTPLHQIVRDWQAAGIKSPRGNPWSTTTLRNMLRSPRLAGYRVYQADICRDQDGRPVKGQYEPILSEELWSALQLQLGHSQLAAGENPGKRKYLLSGLLICECGKRMAGNRVSTKWSPHVYACRPPTTSGGGCGRNAITGSKLDSLVTELVLRRLAGRTASIDESAVYAPVSEIEDKTARIEELMAAYREGVMPASLVFDNVRTLTQELAELRRHQATILRQAKTTSSADAIQSWDQMTVDEQRQVLTEELVAVAIKRASKRGNQFDVTRIEPVWRETA